MAAPVRALPNAVATARACSESCTLGADVTLAGSATCARCSSLIAAMRLLHCDPAVCGGCMSTDVAPADAHSCSSRHLRICTGMRNSTAVCTSGRAPFYTPNSRAGELAPLVPALQRYRILARWFGERSALGAGDLTASVVFAVVCRYLRRISTVECIRTCPSSSCSPWTVSWRRKAAKKAST